MEVVDNDEAREDLVHRFNAQLPYIDSLAKERDLLLADIITALTSAIGARDNTRDNTVQLLRACSGLERMRCLKYNFDDGKRLFIAQALYDLAFPTTGLPLPWHCGKKVMHSLTALIGKKQGQLALVGKLVLPWRCMFATLDECAPRGFPLASGSTERSRLKGLVELIRQARRYWAPGADREIWDEFKEEIALTQTQAAFRALYLLCLFMPTRSSLYEELLPEWFRLWGQVDHCPSWDGAWLTLVCRATQHPPSTFDWTPYMADIYNLARATIRTPVSMGDAGAAPLPRSRQVAYQYHSIAPPACRTGGMVALNKLAVMVVFFLGKGGPAELVRMSDVAIVPPAGEAIDGAYGGGGGDQQQLISPGAKHLMSLFRGLRTYFHPSNGGRWTTDLAFLTSFVLSGLVERVGRETVLREAGRSPPTGTGTGELTRGDAQLLVDSLLPLVLEMVYSKDLSVASLANNCLSLLASLSPKTVAPASAEVIFRALDPVASINHTHQAPAAIRALTCLFHSLMYPRPYLAPYLPALLELTLPGLDANDVTKTTATLLLYHTILCWVPVQGNAISYSTGSLDNWKPAPSTWLDAGEEDEAEDANKHEHLYTACENLGGVLLEWSAAFLDRLFEVLRHKDKSSKVKGGDLAADTMNVAAAMTGLGGAGATAGMMTLNGNWKETLLTILIKLVTQQLFTMADEPAAEMAATKVFRFVTDRALPHVGKDAAGMVEMVASARPERTVSTFFPALCDGLLAASTPSSETPAFASGTSPALLRWRLQLLSGLVRGAGAALAPHGPTLHLVITAGISHGDKGVRKGARKVLRKALQGLCETYPTDWRSLPPTRWAKLSSAAEWRRICEPVAAEEMDIAWVQPSTEGLTLAANLLDDFLVRPLNELALELAREPAENETTVGSAIRAGVWREHLKTIEYAFRGAVCLLGDRGTPGEDDEAPCQHLRDDVYLAVGSRGLSRLLVAKDGHRLYEMVAGLRAETARFMRAALDACAQENGPVDVKSAKLVVRLSQRVACTRGGNGPHSRQVASMLRVGMQRNEVARAMRKMRLNLANEAAANGDTAIFADRRRAFIMGGPGRSRGWPRAAAVWRTSLLHRKRLELAPRTLAIAAKDAAGSRSDTADKPKQDDGERVSWPGASAVLDRYRALFDGLVQLSSSEYAMVRAAAQVGVHQMGNVCPWFVREAVPVLIKRLSLSDPEHVDDESDGGDEDTAHRRLTGACYLLHQRRSMRHIASKWSLSRALLLALCDSQPVLARLPTDKQEKAAARVSILFTTYVSCWRANAVVTNEDKAEHDALQNGLLERLALFGAAASSAGGGWRYQLMASWCLMHLIRPSGSSEHLNARPTSGISTSPTALPMAVWRWFAECLSEGDGQPLQRLALGALTRLLSSADPSSPDAGEVSVLLSSRAFLRPFFLALAYNHRKQATEGGLAGTEQWSLGVKEVMQDVGRGHTRELFPRLRFEARSGLFWARNARLVSAVVSAVREESRGECIRILLEEATTAQADAAHEDKRSFDCAAAEMGAGVVAVLVGDKCWSEGQEVLRETALPFIETSLEGVSLEGSYDWADALRFALDRSTPEGSDPLVSMVVERTKLELRDGGKGRDNYSVLVKWLSFVSAVLTELMGRQVSASRAENIAKQISPLLVDGLDHPFKACRNEIARNLFLVTYATDVSWAAAMAGNVRESILAEAAAVEEGNGGDGERDVANGMATLSVTDATDAGEDEESALLASAMVMSDGAPTEEQKAAASRATKRLSLRRETVLQWLHSTTAAGDHAKHLPIFAALLPVALQSVRDSTVDVSTLGRGVCMSCAVALAARSPKDADLSNGNIDADSAEPSTMDTIVNAALSAASTPSSWRVRRSAAAVTCILQTRLHFVLTPAQHRACDSGLLSLLGDSRREVQETARLAMSTRVAHLTPVHTRAMCEQFAKGAENAAASRKKRRKLAKRQAAAVTAKGAGAGAGSVAVSTGEPASALREQQTNVLGLSAVVLASPCDVPPWVPAALESLAKHANDESPGRLPVRQTVTHTFKEFRRTHQDKWEESQKARFSRDQLDVFDDVLGGAHSYFV